MKNIANAVLSLLVVALSIYGYLQRASALEHRALAETSLEKAIKKTQEAEAFKIQAERNAAEALVQKQLAEKVLQDCLKKK